MRTRGGFPPPTRSGAPLKASYTELPTSKIYPKILEFFTRNGFFLQKNLGFLQNLEFSFQVTFSFTGLRLSSFLVVARNDLPFQLFITLRCISGVTATLLPYLSHPFPLS